MAGVDDPNDPRAAVTIGRRPEQVPLRTKTVRYGELGEDRPRRIGKHKRKRKSTRRKRKSQKKFAEDATNERVIVEEKHDGEDKVIEK